MTEVTRIACPGCRSLLRFEPEALDFPADCGGCDCRFSVGIYVKIACPSCQTGSKIRERYLTQRVRCVRCSHPFIATEGIPQGGGGRLLVARMLDTDVPNPPETIQPFLGHAREEYDRRAGIASPPRPEKTAETNRAAEAEKIKSDVLAERDRLVKEAGLYKAILAKLVTNPGVESDSAIDPTLNESLATLGVSIAPGLPGSSRAQSEVALWRANEEKNRLEAKLKKHQAELDLANSQIQKHQADLEAAHAEVSKHKSLVTEREDLVARTNAERELAEKTHQTLREELEKARAEAEEHKTRFSSEMPSARQAVEEATRQLAEFEAKHGELSVALEEARSNEARLVQEHKQALEEAERQRTTLSITVDRLTQAVISARAGEYEALDRLEEYASSLVESDAVIQADLTAERRRVSELDQIIKELQNDIETIRLENLANAKVRDAEANELRRRFAEERKVLMAEVEKSRAEASNNARRIEEILAKSQEQLDEANTLAEEWRTALEESQTQNQAEIARLEANLAKKEQVRSTLADDHKRLQDSHDRLQSENTRLLSQSSTVGDASPGAPNKKLAQAIEQNQMLHLDNVRLGNLVESAKIEADRRQKSLVLEVQRIKAEYEKLVSANEKLVDRVQELLADKMAMAESLQSAHGGRAASASSVPSALDLDQEVTLANRSKEVELHRDIAFSMLYGDTMVDKRADKNGH